jgi:hypothetical protein
MNSHRIVRIRRAETGDSGDPWRQGAQDLVNKTLLSGSNLTANDLRIPEEVELVLSSNEFSLTASSTFSEPLKDISKAATNFLSGTAGTLFGNYSTQAFATREALEKVSQALAGAGNIYSAAESLRTNKNLKINPWYENIKTWEGSQVTLPPLTFEFAMGQFGLWNAKKEVFAPVLGLLSLGLPTEQRIITADGAFITTSALMGKYIKSAGEAFKGNLFNEDGSLSGNYFSNVSAVLNNTIHEKNSRYYHVSIGDATTLQYCVVTSVAVVISTEVDQHGYPIKAVATLTLQGTVPPAVQSTQALNGLRFGVR